MKILLRRIVLFAGLSACALAYAYSISCNSSGDSCAVTCNNGQHAGTMYWNGSRWSDGIRSSTDRNALARQIVAAQGTACQ
jgi:hypothetical protein